MLFRSYDLTDLLPFLLCICISSINLVCTVLRNFTLLSSINANNALSDCKKVYDMALQQDIKLEYVDIGGGFPGVDTENITFEVIVNKIQGAKNFSEDAILEVVLEAGVEEVNDLGESFEVVCEPSDLVAVRSALQKSEIEYESAESSFLPSLSIPLDAEAAKKVFELIEAIEDLDDVQNVYGNFDVSDEVMASLG